LRLHDCYDASALLPFQFNQLARCLPPFRMSPFLSPFRSSPFIWPSALLPFALLLVCAACLVSVSVRPARPSVSETTRHSGHHSRFVQKSLLLATAAPVLASMSGVLLEPTHRGELFHPALGRSRRDRGPTESPRGAGDDRDRIARSDGGMGQGGPSLGVVICASQRKYLSTEALFAASLPAVAGVVTRRLAQAMPCGSRQIGPGGRAVGRR
jgi:hypothetical protein